MAEKLCLIHSLESGTRELRPGGSMRIGRHRDNDLVLTSSMVSRFHARITWDERLESPVLFDNGSQNGTAVDGKPVTTAATLNNDSKITVGTFILRVEITGVAEEAPAVLHRTNDLVELFSDEGPELRGEFSPEFGILQLLQRLESERRTGSLNLTSKRGEAHVTYCLGRIMWATEPDGQGTRALERIMQIRQGTFHFSRELEPREESMDLWISDYVRSRDNMGQTTRRYRPTMPHQRHPGS